MLNLTLLLPGRPLFAHALLVLSFLSSLKCYANTGLPTNTSGAIAAARTGLQGGFVLFFFALPSNSWCFEFINFENPNLELFLALCVNNHKLTYELGVILFWFS